MIYSIIVETEGGKKFLLTKAKDFTEAVKKAEKVGDVIKVEVSPYDDII